MAANTSVTEDDSPSVCEDQRQDIEFPSLEEVQSDAIFKFLSFCFHQFSDYKSEIRFNRGAADGREGDLKVNILGYVSALGRERDVTDLR